MYSSGKEKIIIRKAAAATLVVVMFVVSMGASTVLAKEFRYSWQKVFPVTGEVTLEMNYLAGDVTIVAYDGDEVRIDAIKRVQAISILEAAELSQRLQIKATRSGNRIRVSTNLGSPKRSKQSFWKRIFGSGDGDDQNVVDFVIAVPEACNLKIASTMGSIKVSDLRGDVTISSSASDIELSGIIGKIDVKNSSGVTRGELIFGPISVRQEVGEIDLQLIEGDIKIRSLSALVTILQERGTLDLQTISGSVYIQTNLESKESFSIESESGSINLMVPATSSGLFDISTRIGAITTDIPVAIKSLTKTRMVGEFGYGGVKITVTSVSGDVTVAQF